MAETLEIENIDGEVCEVTLKYQLRKMCTECPYSNKTKGWIGGHESAKEFHDIAHSDTPFPCHMSTKQSCVGNGIYMNRLCKRSRDNDKASFQDRLRTENNEDVLFSWDGSKLVDFHSK